MSFLLFVVAILGIVVFAVIVNRLTGTRYLYLHELQFAPGEKELWRDAAADFYPVQRLGRAMFMSYSRLKRHTVVWTDRRIVVAQKILFSPKRAVTHQVYFASGVAGIDENKAASELFGGFYGRGFHTIIAETHACGVVNDKACVRIRPTESCGAAQNIDELLVFSDHTAELERSLAPRQLAAGARPVFSYHARSPRATIDKPQTTANTPWPNTFTPCAA